MTRRKKTKTEPPSPPITIAEPRLPERPLIPPELRQARPAEPSEPVGVQCPKCGCQHLYVIYTWQVRGGMTRRRRQCRHCMHEIFTTERIVSQAPDSHR